MKGRGTVEEHAKSRNSANGGGCPTEQATGGRGLGDVRDYTSHI